MDDFRFFLAVRDGRLTEVHDLLGKDPTLLERMGTTFRSSDGWTLFHAACRSGVDFIVSWLLSLPDLDVNHKDNYGNTPFMMAAYNGRSATVRRLLRDSRVNVNEPEDSGETPLYWVAYKGHLEITRWMVASEPRLNLGLPGSSKGWLQATGHPAKSAAKADCEKIASLLQEYRRDPGQTRKVVRGELAAPLFALVVFLSDGLLEIRETLEHGDNDAVRFLLIARHLPMELQMVLCYRAIGLASNIIPGDQRELAFADLGKVFSPFKIFAW